MQRGVALEAIAPEEPDWRQWWPPVRVPTKRQLEQRHSLEVVEGSLSHIEDDVKRVHLTIARQAWLIERDRSQAQQQQRVNKRAREVARRTWQRVVPQLARQGLLTIVDEDVLRDYVIVVTRLDECERNVSDLGIWQRGERGAMKNPATTVANQLRQTMKFYVGELGLTPVARDAMTPREAAGGEEDGFD